jgi:magnesium chelatase family protein
MHPIDARKLVERKPAEPSSVIAARVLKAREIQKKRFEADGIFCNASMNNKLIDRYCPLDEGCRKLMERIIEKMGLSARACSRIIRLARTIADLEGADNIRMEHISEAAGYRFLDKQNILD